MRMMAGLVLGTLVASTAMAGAEPCGASGNQLELDRCADQDFRRADTALNVAYKKVMDRLAGAAPARKLLVDAQQAWLVFRDAECAFSSSGLEGGSMHPMVVTGCRQMLTEARTRNLEAYLTCREGDSCALAPK